MIKGMVLNNRADKLECFMCEGAKIKDYRIMKDIIYEYANIPGSNLPSPVAEILRQENYGVFNRLFFLNSL